MPTIGERLEEARKKKGVSIREAADLTKIRGEYLLKFEGNQFDIGLSDLYVRGFLRGYAAYLHLPTERILSDFAALGRGPTRPRQPTREVYGMMDLTVSAGEPGHDRAAERPEAGSPPSSGGSRPPTVLSRTGASLPRPPALDPVQVLQIVKWAGAGVIALVVILLGRALFSGNPPPRSAHAAAPVNPAVPAAASTYIFVAKGPVHLEVMTVAEGRPVFSGTLAPGQIQVVPKTGPVYVTADPGENVTVEIAGKTYPMPFSGKDRAELR